MNTFGRLLNKARIQKKVSIDEATRGLLEGANLNPYNYDSRIWKIEEKEIRLSDGREVIELRLYKLVDASVVRVESQVRGTIEKGIGALGDFPTDPNHPHFYHENTYDFDEEPLDEGEKTTDSDNQASEG